MSHIRLLSEATVNRIAAGEVIERPAAVAKELVENALDAGATRITVALDGGGIERLEVSDNGVGMTAEELALAVLRHATSKLSDESLIRITTLGFRGEALPSIGAAARLHITSRPHDAAHASMISVEGGVVGAVAPTAGPPGTRVVVRDLFYATPARRKFLKTARIEAEHAEAVVRRLALAAPPVAFRLDIDNRVVFEAPAQPCIERVATLLGPAAAAVLLPVAGGQAGPEPAMIAEAQPTPVQPTQAQPGQPQEVQAHPAGHRADRAAQATMRIGGYVCSPAVTRATAAGQTLVVNNRPVADPVLRTAVRVAYRDVIAAGRHPIVVLYLDLPPGELDVNVHPAKAELRFRDPAAVRALVIGSVRRALGVGTGQVVPMGAARAGRSAAWGRPSAAFNLRLTAGSASVSDGRVDGFAEAQLPFQAAPAARQLPPVTRPPEYSASEAPALESVPAEPLPATLPLATQAVATLPLTQYPLGAPVAQVLDTYVIAVAADGALVLVDQHAAHERLTHEAIREQMMDGGVRAQPLLMPAVVDLPAADVARLLASRDALARLGLELEGFGAGAILVRAMPAALSAPEPAPLLRDLADELTDTGEQTVLSTRLDSIIARLACHGSIRAGRRLTAAEMSALLRQMESTPRAATCSHGRPTVLKLSKADIERMFGRR